MGQERTQLQIQGSSRPPGLLTIALLLPTRHFKEALAVPQAKPQYSKLVLSPPGDSMQLCQSKIWRESAEWIQEQILAPVAPSQPRAQCVLTPPQDSHPLASASSSLAGPADLRSTTHTDFLEPSLCPALAGSGDTAESDPVTELLLALGIRGWGGEKETGKEGLRGQALF